MNRSIVLGMFLCVIVTSLESAEREGFKIAKLKSVNLYAPHQQDEIPVRIKVDIYSKALGSPVYTAHFLDKETEKKILQLVGFTGDIFNNLLREGYIRFREHLDDETLQGAINLRYECIVDGKEQAYRVGNIYLQQHK
jgi:hypothetical protein